LSDDFLPSSTSVTISCRQVKVARSAMKQALAWNEDDDMGVKKAGRKIRFCFWDGETNCTVTFSSLRKAGHGHGGRKKESEKREVVARQAGAGQPNLQEEVDDDEDDEDRVESSRLDEFGDWLEQEQDELPEEFRLRTE
jgi:hypothetical protein